jgi:hypothetical protein
MGAKIKLSPLHFAIMYGHKAVVFAQIKRKLEFLDRPRWLNTRVRLWDERTILCTKIYGTREQNKE